MRTVIVTAKAIYQEGRLIFRDAEVIPEDGTEVIVNFERQPPKSLISLRDSWAKYFPPEIDLDGQLQQIRQEWEAEMEAISE